MAECGEGANDVGKHGNVFVGGGCGGGGNPEEVGDAKGERGEGDEGGGGVERVELEEAVDGGKGEPRWWMTASGTVDGPWGAGRGRGA